MGRGVRREKGVFLTGFAVASVTPARSVCAAATLKRRMFLGRVLNPFLRYCSFCRSRKRSAHAAPLTLPVNLAKFHAIALK
jgi:hypothetical protein